MLAAGAIWQDRLGAAHPQRNFYYALFSVVTQERAGDTYVPTAAFKLCESCSWCLEFISYAVVRARSTPDLSWKGLTHLRPHRPEPKAAEPRRGRGSLPMPRRQPGSPAPPVSLPFLRLSRARSSEVRGRHSGFTVQSRSPASASSHPCSAPGGRPSRPPLAASASHTHLKLYALISGTK